MERIACFHKVTALRFIADWCNATSCTPAVAQEVYEKIKIPHRATAGSAGYDFFAPIAFTLAPRETITIPTGLRVEIEEGWVMQIFPRSGLGFRYRLQLNNTVGIIDSDYYHADNEGHIFIKITNDTNEGKTLAIRSGQGYAQGIFLPFGVTLDDDVVEQRHGGLGSTTKAKE